MVGHFLENSGHSVRYAASGVDALMITEATQPDIVLLEYRLPDGDGISWLQQLRMVRPGVTAKIAVFTADWSMDESRREVQRLGAIVAMKPCSLYDIGAIVAYLLGGERAPQLECIW